MITAATPNNVQNGWILGSSDRVAETFMARARKEASEAARETKIVFRMFAYVLTRFFRSAASPAVRVWRAMGQDGEPRRIWTLNSDRNHKNRRRPPTEAGQGKRKRPKRGVKKAR